MSIEAMTDMVEDMKVQIEDRTGAGLSAVRAVLADRLADGATLDTEEVLDAASHTYGYHITDDLSDHVAWTIDYYGIPEHILDEYDERGDEIREMNADLVDYAGEFMVDLWAHETMLEDYRLNCYSLTDPVTDKVHWFHIG